MTGPFGNIGLFAKHNNRTSAETFEKLILFLKTRGHTLWVEPDSATLLSQTILSQIKQVDKTLIGQYCDLCIVVGGDGSLLNAARHIVKYQKPILGINRGRLGFLADITPHNMESLLTEILDGTYTEEQRFLLQAQVQRDGHILHKPSALNDIVLYTGGIARMIEFEVYINQQFVLRQRSDGLITATPTGSTAYALSGGGPILHPSLNAMVLVPMFPHTLTSRPIVVTGDSEIELRISTNNELHPKLSFDGQLHVELNPNDSILIQQLPQTLQLIDPKNYNYFSVLREKLAWSTLQIKD